MKPCIFTRGLQWSIQASAWLQLAVGLTACAQPGFECGREVPGKPGTFRRCDEFNEICVCYTNSCAKVVPKVDPHPKTQPEAKADAGGSSNSTETEPSGIPEFCPSGYRYVDAPFASTPNACVEQWQLELSGDAGLLDQAKGQLMCPGAPETPKPEDPTSTGAPDSGAGSSSNTVPDAMTQAPTTPDAAQSSGAHTDAASSGGEPTDQTSSSQASSADSTPTGSTTSATEEQTTSSSDASVGTSDSSVVSSDVAAPGQPDASLGSSL